MALTSQVAVERSKAAMHLLGKNYMRENEHVWLVTVTASTTTGRDEAAKTAGPQTKALWRL